VETDVKKVAMDYLFSAAYQGTPLAHSKYGTLENIKCVVLLTYCSHSQSSLQELVPI